MLGKNIFEHECLKIDGLQKLDESQVAHAYRVARTKVVDRRRDDNSENQVKRKKRRLTVTDDSELIEGINCNTFSLLSFLFM